MSYIIPLIVLFIIIYSFKKKISIYDEFLDGAKEGLITVYNIIPSIVAMVFAINLFLRSGVINLLLFPFVKIFSFINIPVEVVSMAFLRPISGSASLALMTNVYKIYGVDSFASFLSSILQGCTDTTIYVLALYFGSVKISKTRYALPVGLFADFCGIVAAIIISYLMF